ncbi:MAG: hypothetical protein HYY49_00645 [Ignavibacteriales bacterium]|nr:hypothetical protein [Ignavibacteriales bacterium]
MGQQQLLLIVLAVMIVGMAIFAGTRLFVMYQQSNERDVIIQQMSILVLEAKKYATRPANLDGGDGRFSGFQPPLDLAQTDRVRIYTGATDSAVTFSGFGSVNGDDGQNPVQVVMSFTLSDERPTVEVVN